MITELIKNIGAAILNTNLDDRLKGFWVAVLTVAAINFIGWIVYQGLINSYWGKNIREEITRVFNKMSKHWRKENV